MSEISINSVVVTIAGVDIDVSNAYDAEKGAAQQFEAQSIAIKALAEENAKLRKLCGDFLTVSVCAINAGDWKVDGAADPDSLIREAKRIL